MRNRQGSASPFAFFVGAALVLALSATVTFAWNSHTNCVFNETRWEWDRSRMEARLQAAMPFLETYFDRGSPKGIAGELACDACIVTVDAFILELKLGVDPETIIGELSFLCWLIPNKVFELKEDECCGLLTNYIVNDKFIT